MAKRRLTPPPVGVTPVKTSRGTWIAMYEIWEGNELVNLVPMRSGDGGPIIQARERREVIQIAERARLETENMQLRRQLEQAERLRKGDAPGNLAVSHASSLMRNVS
jgi:hypothetical protein